MIVSHKHKFIFVKTRKTAGTSIEIVLEGFCGDADIVTPIFGSDDEKGRHTARNDEGYYNHMGVADIRRSVGEAVWSSYFKFAFDRNPWDKQISMYWWRKHQHDLPDTFREYCLKANGRNEGIYMCPTDYHLYSENGMLSVDFIGRYESLEADLRRVLNEVGIPYAYDLPRAKSKYRPKAGYRGLYDDLTAEIVRTNFVREIDCFGYRFA